MKGYKKVKLIEPFMHKELGDASKLFIPFYAINPVFGLFTDDPRIHYDRMDFQMMFPIKANNLDQVFSHMQGEMWSPNGEAVALIHELGLSHTSMSVGDIILACEHDTYYLVEGSGFKVVQLI